MIVFKKKYIRYNRLKKPSTWVIIHTNYSSRIISASFSFLLQKHLKIIIFYLRKILGKPFRKPNFLTTPRYWLTSKPKTSRMGKGKGALSTFFFPIKKGSFFIALPILPRFLLARVLRTISLRLPFKASFTRFSLW